MKFGIAVEPSEKIERKVSIPGWPEISTVDARDLLRIDGTVTDDRLVECIENALHSVSSELEEWRAGHESCPFDTEQKKSLFRRAVLFYAHAELLERYHNFDAVGGSKKERQSEAITDSRRTSRWALRDLIGRPRLTVWMM